MTFTDLDEAKDTARWLAKSADKTVYLFKYTEHHYEVEVFSWYFDVPYMKFYPNGDEQITYLYREGNKDEEVKQESENKGIRGSESQG